MQPTSLLPLHRLALALLFTLVACAGSSNEDPGPDQDAVVFSHQTFGALHLYATPSEYEFVNEMAKRTVSGTLAPDEGSTLKQLTTPELQAVYKQNAASDYSACTKAGGYVLGSQRISENCYLVEQVSDPRTKAMLDAFVPLFAKYKLQSEQAP
jgi:hypothetical protein